MVKVLRSVLEQSSLLFMALIMAVFVWLAAVNEENPVVTQPFSRELNVTLTDPGENIALINAENIQAIVNIRAPQDVFDSLTTNRIRITADISELEPGLHAVPLTALVTSEQAEIISIIPAEIQVQLEEISTRTLPLRREVIGEPARGYFASPPTWSAEEISITGLQSVVNSIAEVRLEVDIQDRKTELDRSYIPRAYNADGIPVNNVDFEPENVSVLIEIAQLESYRELAVRPNIVGQVASGFRVTGITQAPQSVTVFSSEANAIANLPGFVETEPIDITGINNDNETRVTLALPESISLIGEQSVVVQISVAAIENSFTITERPQVVGLGPELTAVLSPLTVDVIVSGPVNVLDALEPDDIKVVIDLLDLEAETIAQIEPELIVAIDNIDAELVIPTIQVEITATEEE